MTDTIAFFHGQPEVRFLDTADGGRLYFMLLKPFSGYSPVFGRDVTAPAGFVSDGQSIPRLVVGLTGRECIRAGILHDWLYQAHMVALTDAEEITRQQADCAYDGWLIADGVDEVHALQQWAALDFYGQRAWDSGPSRRQMLAVEAP
jgi:hypothetical protein